MRGLRTFLARRLLRVFALACALLLRPPSAHALENSELEERSVTRVLGPHPDRDDSPEGKRIESVEVVRLPVFDDDDPVPDLLNVFHVQTRERAIRRELLFEAGQRYQGERVQETLRNLQLLPQFGVVVIVALRGHELGQVRVVVIVRDVWSLRLNYQLQGTPQSINYLFVNLSEDNLLGTRTRLGSIFTLQPDRYSLGALAVHPRVLGSKVDAYALGRVFVNLDSGKAEGSAATLSVYRPLIALADRWAFLTGVGWDIEQTRLYSDRRLLLSKQGIPLAYHTSVVRGGGELTRSFGERLKFNLTWGVEFVRRDYQATRSPDVSPQKFERFVREELPVSDTRLSPFFQLEHRTTRFLATRDVETLALQESFSLGQLLALRVYPALRGLASSRDLLGTAAWLGYTWPLGNGLLRVIGNSSIEQANDEKDQASAQAALRVVSPRLGFMRLVADSALVATYRNHLNRKLVLGGDSRPRGYVSATFRGASGFAASLELRTFAINVLSARVGAVAFYDAGGTGDGVEDIALHQSLGAGLRILFPQVNRQCFRVDWAAPLTPGFGRIPDRPLPGGVYFTFNQAFDMPNTKLPEILSAEGSLLDLTK